MPQDWHQSTTLSARGPTHPFHAFHIRISIPFNLRRRIIFWLRCFRILLFHGVKIGHPPPRTLKRDTPDVHVCLRVTYANCNICDCVRAPSQDYVNVCVCFINCKPLSTTRQNNIGLALEPVHRFGTQKLDTFTN